ncbi:MAG: glutathione S-transferase family protein [Gammaproteobacteria bacterium]
MVMLLGSDVRTKEVLGWRGVHLFHFGGSSCSQKVRIFLHLKRIDWVSHPVNLARREQTTPYYMGINPRGLVPTLVHDGQVVIESNDIIEYLEERFPDPVLIPRDSAERMHELLREEDDLHLDLRALTMRFIVPSFLAKKSEREIAAYESLGSGTVLGRADPNRLREIHFWRGMNAHDGITDARACAAVANFRARFDRFDQDLANRRYLLGNELTVLDIGWYIYARRLRDASYPLRRLHPRFGRWFDELDARPGFRREVRSPALLRLLTRSLHVAQRARGTTLAKLAGLGS